MSVFLCLCHLCIICQQVPAPALSVLRLITNNYNKKGTDLSVPLER